MSDAALAPRVPRSDVPPPMLDYQVSCDVALTDKTPVGEPKPPPCPSCGHHLAPVHKRRRSSLHP